MRIHIRRHQHPPPPYHPPMFLIQPQGTLLMRRGGEIDEFLPVGLCMGNDDFDETARDTKSSVFGGDGHTTELDGVVLGVCLAYIWKGVYQVRYFGSQERGENVPKPAQPTISGYIPSAWQTSATQNPFGPFVTYSPFSISLSLVNP